MSYCLWTSSERQGRTLPWCLVALLATVISCSTAAATFAQATKAADSAADSADDGSANRGQTIDAKVLIGDAVDDADSPQYRKVTSAIDLFSQRRVKEARDLLAEARTTQPRLPPAEVLIAKLFILARQPQLAMAELEQAVQKFPRDPEAYLILADGSLNERRITAAASLYRDAEELLKSFTENPKRKENFEKRVLNGLAAVAFSRQQWPAAETLYRQLLKLDPKNAGAHQRLGTVLFQQASPQDRKKLGESYTEFAAALEHDPKAIKPDVAMGQLFEQAAQQALSVNDDAKYKQYRKEAVAAFERATASKPDLNTLMAAATWALQTNQFKLAQQYADRAMKMDSDSLDAMFVAAIVARFSGDLKTAERLLNTAFNQSPSSFPISNQLALVLAESSDKNDKERALELAQINARLNQNSAEAAATLGWVLYHLDRKADAGKVLQNVVNSRQVTADSAYYVSKILADQDRNADAIQILQDALENPQPFANRINASNLLAELKKELDSKGPTDGKDNTQTTPTSTSSGKRGAGAERTKARGTK